MPNSISSTTGLGLLYILLFLLLSALFLFSSVLSKSLSTFVSYTMAAAAAINGSIASKTLFDQVPKETRPVVCVL